MELRSIISNDREKILRLLQDVKVFSRQEIKVALEVIDDALRWPEKKDYLTFCAFNGTGDLAGYICFGPIPMTDARYDLYWIAVDKRFSRKGVGGKLLGFMEKFLAGKKARRIYVETSSTEPYEAARLFYGKHGYQLVCSMKDFYREGDHKMIFMKEVG